MHKKKCPKCGRQYCELSNYCNKCGIALVKNDNRCSGNKTTQCSHKAFADDDLYCDYCGSLTAYALEAKERRGGDK